jgi:curved DNA-binding protein CbpA
MKNYYEILEINQNVTLSDIEKSYQRLSLRWHPDKHTADRKLAEKKFH